MIYVELSGLRRLQKSPSSTCFSKFDSPWANSQLLQLCTLPTLALPLWNLLMHPWCYIVQLFIICKTSHNLELSSCWNSTIIIYSKALLDYTRYSLYQCSDSLDASLRHMVVTSFTFHFIQIKWGLLMFEWIYNHGPRVGNFWSQIENLFTEAAEN